MSVVGIELLVPLIHHKHGLIGAAVSRIDGPLKVSGKAQFCAEFPMDWLTYAASPVKYSRRLREAAS